MSEWTPEVGDKVEVPDSDSGAMIPGTIVSVDGAYFAVRLDNGEESPINWVPDDGVVLVEKVKPRFPKQQRYLVAYPDPRPNGLDDDNWKAYTTWATSPAAAVERRRPTASFIYVFEFEKEGLVFRASRDYVLEPKPYEAQEPPEVEEYRGAITP